jgi:hypothetical protein
MTESTTEFPLIGEIGEGLMIDNLSLYPPESELTLLNNIAEKRNMPVSIIPVIRDGQSLGYVIVPLDQSRQRQIVAEAPMIFTDFDDTAAQTSSEKKRCWQLLEAEGIPAEVIAKSDKLARIAFGHKSGEIYEPELDMRLLTYAKNQLAAGISIEHVLESLKLKTTEYLDQIQAKQTIDEIEPIDESIRAIFDQTRYAVELYPDTVDLLTALRDEHDVKSNVFVSTYGDPAFQFEKTVGLLHENTVQAVMLIKTNKGDFFDALFEQNPLKTLDLSYWDENDVGKGIDLKAYANPVIVMDDDPNQVASLNKMAIEKGLPMVALWRQRSEEHKRGAIATPEGEYVWELARDAEGRITESVLDLRNRAFSLAIEQMIVGNFARWLNQIKLQEAVAIGIDRSASISENPRATVIDFFRDNLNEAGKHIQAVAEYRFGQADEDSLKKVKESVIRKAITLIAGQSLQKPAMHAPVI